MSRAGSDNSTGGQAGQLWRNRWFLGCLAMLVVFTIGFEFKFRHTVICKDPMPLRKSLSQLDRQKLVFRDGDTSYSYRLEGQPAQLDPEMVDKLGTDQYISWTIRLWDDTQQRATDEGFYLFVTYYTGKPDQVPHVPEECYLGNAFFQKKDWMEQVKLPGLAAKDQVANLQALLFVRDAGAMFGGRQRKLVMYTFRVNDQWHADREEVRRVLGNPFEKSAYFCKVELGFPLPPDMPEEPEEAVKKAMQEGKRFMETALPILVQEHFPIWQPGNAQAQTQPTADGSKTQSPEAHPSIVKG